MSERIVIDTSKCTGCMLCAKVCFLNFEADGNGKARAVEQPALCVACGHCVAVCPTQAIAHPKLDAADIEPIDESNRPSYEQFLAFLKMRRSQRNFKDKPVPREVIDKLLGAAVQAPNGLNRHNVCYTVITDRAVLKELSGKIMQQMNKLVGMMRNPVGRLFFKTFMRRMYKELEFFMPLIDQISNYKDIDMVMYDAPCLIVAHTIKGDMCGEEDSVYSAANIGLAAETLGLGTCVIGFVTGPLNGDPRMKKLAGIPLDHKVQTSIIVGYPEFGYKHTAPKMGARVEYLGS